MQRATIALQSVLKRYGTQLYLRHLQAISAMAAQAEAAAAAAMNARSALSQGAATGSAVAACETAASVLRDSGCDLRTGYVARLGGGGGGELAPVLEDSQSVYSSHGTLARTEPLFQDDHEYGGFNGDSGQGLYGQRRSPKSDEQNKWSAASCESLALSLEEESSPDGVHFRASRAEDEREIEDHSSPSWGAQEPALLSSYGTAGSFTTVGGHDEGRSRLMKPEYVGFLDDVYSTHAWIRGVGRTLDGLADAESKLDCPPPPFRHSFSRHEEPNATQTHDDLHQDLGQEESQMLSTAKHGVGSTAPAVAAQHVDSDLSMSAENGAGNDGGHVEARRRTYQRASMDGEMRSTPPRPSDRRRVRAAQHGGGATATSSTWVEEVGEERGAAEAECGIEGSEDGDVEILLRETSQVPSEEFNGPEVEDDEGGTVLEPGVPALVLDLDSHAPHGVATGPEAKAPQDAWDDDVGDGPSDSFVYGCGPPSPTSTAASEEEFVRQWHARILGHKLPSVDGQHLPPPIYPGRRSPYQKLERPWSASTARPWSAGTARSKCSSQISQTSLYSGRSRGSLPASRPSSSSRQRRPPFMDIYGRYDEAPSRS